MSLKQALDDACAVEEKIYLLFPAGRRITVYAQQVRALTLVEALRETEWMPKVQSVAIVGGGISGITAAMALYVAKLRETLTVTIFESRDRLVPLQASCRDKVLAPHIIDWPQKGADEPHADLPVLEWTSAMAGEVATDLQRQFERAEMDVRLLAKVTGISTNAQGVEIAFEQNGVPSRENFEVVIVAAGFGLEEQPAKIQTHTPSYWRVIRDQQVDLTEDSAKKILISGLGDGGLIDFVLFSCPALSHERLCRDLMDSIDVRELIADLEEIEAKVWEDPPTIDDIGSVYQTLRLDKIARELILPALVRNKAFTLLTRGPGELARSAAPLNRLAAATVIHAIRTSTDRGTTVEIVTEATLLREEADHTYVYERAGKEVSRQFDLAIVRHGDSQLDAWKFGCSEIDTKVAALRKQRDSSTVRPETPILSNAVRAAITERALKRLSTRIRVDKDSHRVRWQSDVGVDHISKLWPSASVSIEIAFEPAAEPGKLEFALARFMGHFEPPVQLKSPFHVQWRNLINQTHRFAGLGPDEPEVHLGAISVQRNLFTNQPDILADHLNAAMDFGLLRLLDKKMTHFIEEPAKAMPVILHADIRKKVLAAWPDWHARMSAKGTEERDWILVLFGNLLDDMSQISPWSRVRVGPRCLENEILPAVIYHLAMRTLLTDFGDACKHPNGNVARLLPHHKAAHVCGSGFAVDENGEALMIDLWDPVYPGARWLPSALVLPSRRADFLPVETSTRPKPSAGMLGQPWARPPIVHASPRLLQSLRLGEAEAVAELRKMLDIKLPTLD